jgi:signal transduction histidine kinase/DNA-binding NarL/FixJ family response regulator
MTMFAIHPEWPLERYIDDPRLLRSAGSLTFECMYRRKDGKLFPAEVTVTDLDHDTRICYCVFARNITERKRVLSELTAAKQSADSAAQAKIQFLANMSHEIRTPMTAIAGYLDLVNRSSEKLPENCREWVTRARRSVSHLLSLLNDILDLAKVDSGQMFLHCDLHGVVELIDEVCAFFIPQTREKLLRLTVNYSTAMPSVAFTDSTRLRQILINVIGNAVKFTETGSVAVDVSVVPLPGTDTPWLRVVVTDTGIGIPAEKLSQLFAPFTQLHDLRACRYGGTGLGLDISRRLARLFGGDVTADSTEGVGSVFTTTLPIVVPPSARWLPAVELQHVARSHPDSVLPAHDFSNRHILVVDDNPDNQSILRFLLADTNATITIAEDGLAGIRAVLAAAKTAAPFDLVLMDMRMPVMDGYVATERLREIGVRTPIVALTASVMGGDEDKCRQAGCDAYLSKPIDPAQLLATIAKYVQAPIDTQGALNTGATSRTSVNLSETARFAPLLTKYMRGLPNVMTAIRTAMEAGNTHNIRAIAHRTRGTAENFGFPELTRAAGLLEDTIDEESSVERIAAGVDAVLCLMQSALIKYKEQVAEHANAQFSS